MAVSSKFILHQGPVIAALGQGAARALMAQAGGGKAPKPSLPGPEVQTTLPARPSDLVRTYIRHVGGDPGWYRGRIPAHMFPQWGFALAAQGLSRVDYPLHKIMNAGVRIEAHAPLPTGEPLRVRARLEDIDDNGRRALIRFRVVTGTASAPDAVVGFITALVPLGRGKGGDKGEKKKEPALVPETAREIGFWRIGPGAGLDFAKLTGDFNPVHWLGPYAHAFGFRGCILHGFSTAARAVEGLNRAVLAGAADRVRVFDARFTRPLVLPAKVGLYLTDEGRVLVGDAPGSRAYLDGQLELAATA